MTFGISKYATLIVKPKNFTPLIMNFYIIHGRKKKKKRYVD